MHSENLNYDKYLRLFTVFFCSWYNIGDLHGFGFISCPVYISVVCSQVYRWNWKVGAASRYLFFFLERPTLGVGNVVGDCLCRRLGGSVLFTDDPV